MKKLSIYILMVMCLFVTGCGVNKEKTVATLDDFNVVLVNNNFTVHDNMDDYNDVDYILDAKKALYEDVEIEMIEYIDSEYAKKVQDAHIDKFNLLKSTGAFEDTEKGNNYYKYILVSNNRYMISSRVENTLVFCKTMLENKEIVEKIYNELGY